MVLIILELVLFCLILTTAPLFHNIQIGSTILAQAASVPTLPWSGTGVSVSYTECGGVIPADIYGKVADVILCLLY